MNKTKNDKTKNDKTKIDKTKNDKTKTKKMGGRPFASGSYGCIFYPPIECQGTKERQWMNDMKNKGIRMISKLFLETHAKEEYTTIEKWRKILRKIPNYKKYFIMDEMNYCKPKKFTPEDLKNFDNMCKDEDVFSHYHGVIDSTVANNPEILEALRIVQMPYGAIELNKSWKTKKKRHWKKLNHLMKEMLREAIIPMNRLGLNHGDIRDKNILVSENSMKIIDWGFAWSPENSPLSIYDKWMNIKIPQHIKNFVYIFWFPLSTLIMTDLFESRYNTFKSFVNGNGTGKWKVEGG
jgi:hypothetical protein